MKRLFIILMTMMLTTLGRSQGVKPLPSLHVEGRWLVDTHGNHVVLHGVMDTPNMYFNGWRWGSPWDGSNTGYNTTGATKCKNYFEKLFAGMEESKCTVFRLHMDPAWTNDPSDSYKYAGSEGQASDASGEADIKKFNPNRLKTYLKSVYFPLAQKAMNHGMYVVIRPPGVCPHNIQVGDYYNQYLMTVWDIFSQNDSIRKYAGQISIELANEPVNLRNADGQDDAKALHDFFQPIVDKIRANGFTGIIWVPGTGYQSNYRSYASWPIEGYNIGYAVHDYPGWYNSSDDNPGITNKRNSFHDAVPVVDTNPILISEVDWSPIKEPKEVDHYNEMGQPTYKNLGTWATASTSKWGKAYKAMLDYFGNISMTLTSTGDYFDIDTLLNKKKVVASFDGNPEACAKACMDWYADFYTKDWAHADFKNFVVSDLGNGTYRNPIIAADFPDPDVIRVDDTYYMVSSTTNCYPEATVVKSHDLVNWEYCDGRESRKIVENVAGEQSDATHQKALFDTPDGEWWTIIQEDHGVLGRMPSLQPVKWVDGSPVVGNNGEPYAIYSKPNVGSSYPRNPLPTNDNFRSYPLGMQWQWNHNPDDGAWTLFERPGWLRMKTGTVTERLTQACNILTQRIFAYTDKASLGTVCIDASHLQEGDRAGICILQEPYAMIAVEVKDGQHRIVCGEQAKTVGMTDVVYLRASVNCADGKTQFCYSLDNKTFTPLGEQTLPDSNLTTAGARFGLFCYATKEHEERGYADFDWFSTEDSYDEASYYPADFTGYNEDMLTAEKIELSVTQPEVMIGNSIILQMTATFRDGHTENVASQTLYEMVDNDCIMIQNGRLYGLKEGEAQVKAVYTDPMGHELEAQFNVRSTFFPFGAQHIKTDFFGNGTYTEKTHTFRPGQWGQMGWEYPSGIDMSDYKYLVIKLSATSSSSHLNIFTENSIWSPCYSTADFGTKTQIVVNLQTAKYTSDGNKKGQQLDTKNIRIVAFWGNGSQDIKVKDMYLTNNADYSPNGIDAVRLMPVGGDGRVYDLQGRRVNSGALEKGVYIKDGKKIMIMHN